MKVNLELLFHYRCDRCNVWWSVADLCPKEVTTCPHCDFVNQLEGVEYKHPTILDARSLDNLAKLLAGAACQLQDAAKKNHATTLEESY